MSREPRTTVPPTPCARSTSSCCARPRASRCTASSALPRQARKAFEEDGADRLGPRRGAGVRLAAGARRAGAPDRPGHRARHLLASATWCSTMPRRGERWCRSRSCATPRRRSSCTTARSPSRAVPRLRVRLQRPGARHARAVGGAVRRLRELGAGDRGPVHVAAWPSGADLAACRCCCRTATRARARAFERAARALPPARRRGQHPRRQLHHPRAVLPPAPPPGARVEVRAARADDAQEPAAPPAARLRVEELAERRLPARDRRPEAAAPASRSPSSSSAPARSTTTSLGFEDAPRGADIAVARVEQLYPFPETSSASSMESYPPLERVSGCQEEPRNMGARAFMRRRMAGILPRRSPTATWAASCGPAPARATRPPTRRSRRASCAWRSDLERSARARRSANGPLI